MTTMSQNTATAATSEEYSLTPALSAKREKVLEKRRDWRDELRRLHWYLGSKKSLELSFLVHTYHFHKDELAAIARPVLISLDIEVYEFNSLNITEIGIAEVRIGDDKFAQTSVYDADSVRSVINARHLRIREYGHLVNKKHVQGCPDRFNFGKSEWISEDEIPDVVRSIFKGATAYWGHTTIKPVLVGQSIQSDINFLRGINFDLTHWISDCLDTNKINKIIRRNDNDRALSALLKDHRIPFQHLHNAGNDAYYTMRLILVTANVPAPNESTRIKRKKEMEKEILQAKRLAEFNVRLRFEGWSDEEKEEGEEDGEGEVGDIDMMDESM